MSKEKANEQINKSIGVKEKSKSATRILGMSFVGVCFLVLAGVVLYFLLLKSETDARGFNTVVTPENIEEIIAQQEEIEYVPVGSYVVSMNTDWTFPNGESPSPDAYVGNSIANRNTVYFELKRRDNNEVILESPYIIPGSHIENITLDEVLSAGTYDTILTFHLVDDDLVEISHVSVAVTITIQN